MTPGGPHFSEAFIDRAGAFLFVCSSLLVLALRLPHPAGADSDAEHGFPICTAKGVQQYPEIASDGVGGAIVAWWDARNGNDDIYAQRISADGAVQWIADGVALCIEAGSQRNPAIASDGAGGAIFAWQDYRRGYLDCDIYVKRISVDGRALWTADGLALCAARGQQWNQAIIADGAGGAIVAWQDYRNNDAPDIYAQRISADGTPRWPADGVALCTAPGTQIWPKLTRDGAGGAIVIWEDGRERYGDGVIYAQRIAPDGTVQWDSNGVALCTAARRQNEPTLVPDGAGGAIVAWRDWRNRNDDVYAQRISATGMRQWMADGVALWDDSCRMRSHAIVADGAGGAIISSSAESGGNGTIRVQRISGDAALRWSAGGVVLCSAAGQFLFQNMIADAAGGAIVTWTRYRRGGKWKDVYAQRISADGGVQWLADGVAVCTKTGDPFCPAFVSDGAGGAIFTWSDSDFRSRTKGDIYAQILSASGQIKPRQPAPPPAKVGE
jgi:hypothetical protein